MTIEEKIEAALFARVRELDLDGSPPFAWPNTSFKPPVGSYVRVDHLPNRNARLFIGSTAPHLRQGILQLTVVTPLNGGNSLATGLAGAIAEHFAADLAMFEDDVKVRVQKAPDVKPAERTDDDVSWSARVDVLYECFG